MKEKQEVIPIAMNTTWMDPLLDSMWGNKLPEDKLKARLLRL